MIKYLHMKYEYLSEECPGVWKILEKCTSLSSLSNFVFIPNFISDINNIFLYIVPYGIV